MYQKNCIMFIIKHISLVQEGQAQAIDIVLSYEDRLKYLTKNSIAFREYNSLNRMNPYQRTGIFLIDETHYLKNINDYLIMYES